jgi:hypothetical protein
MSEDSRDPRTLRSARAPPGPLPAREIVERLKLERKPTNASVPHRRSWEITTGRLEAHGAANYEFRSNASPSYYVKILSDRGPETFWGVDLERAIKQAKTQPKIGSMIGLRRAGSELVTLPARSADRSTDRERTFRRTQWIVESVTFFAESRERARRERESRIEDQRTLSERPELRSAFITLHVAEKFAERYIRDPRDRTLFVERVKAVMALSASNGAPMPEPWRRELPAPASRRDDPTR